MLAYLETIVSKSLRKKKAETKIISAAEYQSKKEQTRIVHIKQLALEESVKNFSILHKNAQNVELFSAPNYESYLSRLNDMALYMKERNKVRVDTALPDLTRIIARILQFAERHGFLAEIAQGCHWNPLIPSALEILLADSAITANYQYIHQKLIK